MLSVPLPVLNHSDQTEQTRFSLLYFSGLPVVILGTSPFSFSLLHSLLLLYLHQSHTKYSRPFFPVRQSPHPQSNIFHPHFTVIKAIPTITISNLFSSCGTCDCSRFFEFTWHYLMLLAAVKCSVQDKLSAFSLRTCYLLHKPQSTA